MHTSHTWQVDCIVCEDLRHCSPETSALSGLDWRPGCWQNDRSDQVLCRWSSSGRCDTERCVAVNNRWDPDDTAHATIQHRSPRGRLDTKWPVLEKHRPADSPTNYKRQTSMNFSKLQLDTLVNNSDTAQAHNYTVLEEMPKFQTVKL